MAKLVKIVILLSLLSSCASHKKIQEERKFNLEALSSWYFNIEDTCFELAPASIDASAPNGNNKKLFPQGLQPTKVHHRKITAQKHTITSGGGVLERDENKDCHQSTTRSPFLVFYLLLVLVIGVIIVIFKGRFMFLKGFHNRRETINSETS